MHDSMSTYMEFLTSILNHRVDAAVSRVLCDPERAAASLTALDKVIHDWSKSVSWGDQIAEDQFQRFILEYPEHQSVAKAGLDEGLQFFKDEAEWEKIIESERQERQDQCNDDSDWGDFDSLAEEISDGNKAFDNGFNAHGNGLDQNTNPHPSNTILNDYWDSGWFNGKRGSEL